MFNFRALIELLTFTQAGRFFNPAYANPDDFATAYGPSTNPTIHIPDTIIPAIFISFGIVYQSHTVKGRPIGMHRWMRIENKCKEMRKFGQQRSKLVGRDLNWIWMNELERFDGLKFR